MLHVKDENTETPQVDWVNKTATCICEICETEKTNFPLFYSVRFDGNSFIFSSASFNCGCEYTTVYPLHADHPTAKIIGKLSGLLPMEDPE